MSTTSAATPLSQAEIIKLINDAIKLLQEGLSALDPDGGPIDPPEPNEGPIGGEVQDKGANTDPHTWKSTKMKDKEYKGLWKVVDDEGVNVAHKFSSQANADRFIQEVIKNLPPVEPPQECPEGQVWDATQKKCIDKPVDPDPPVDPPNPGGTGVDKHGVKLLLADGSNVDYDVTKNFRSDGKRFDFEGPKAAKMVNCELTGYFADFDGIDDEVSGKQRGGGHSDGSKPKTYDMGVKTTNGACRYRTEETHPDYEDATAINTLASGLGVGLRNKFIGYKFICRNVLDNKAVNLQIWQDTGDNEGTTPANQWKQIANYVVKDPLWLTVASDHQETIRIDDDNGCPNLKYKWLSCAEIK